MSPDKDFSTISPSAKSLLLMKGYTNIPYAKEAAALMPGPEVFGVSFDESDFWFWVRVMHFESRYRSIDQLLQQAADTHILELSSGYSFRGIDLCAHSDDIHYIDTDLPDVVATKQAMIDRLGLAAQVKGRYELVPLNALDETAFIRVVNKFGNGPITIVNEGLLMYLDSEEKKRLCRSIHNVLAQRGGCWITGDIYVKRPPEQIKSMPQSRSEANFMEQHNIEENKFGSYEAAQAFFEQNGFKVIKEAQPNYQELSVMPRLVKALPEELRNSRQPPPKLQATWMLAAK